jgi:enterochelin esterase-like enzyme
MRGMRTRSRSRGIVVGSLVVGSLVGAFLVVGALGAYRYANGFWLYRGFAPPRDAATGQHRGALRTIFVRSAAIGGRRQKVLVYLPPGYGRHPRRRYPVLYLLHGVPGQPQQFFDADRLGVLLDRLAGRIRPLILVAPDGSTGVWTDKEWVDGVRPHEGWETYFARDVVHAVDTRYRTIARGAGRAVAGLSEGGYAALNIGLHHPREFRVIESWSGYMRADHIQSIFGGQRSRLAYDSPALRLPAVAAVLRRRHVFVWMYCGTRDSLRRQNAAFAIELLDYGVRHRFFTSPGAHTWRVWRPNARPALLVAARRLA